MALDPALPVGRRIRYYRERAGKSRETLAALLGRSASWLKQIENGTLLPPRLPMLMRIAERLGIEDLSLLTGDVSMPRTLYSWIEHESLAAVRRAVDGAPLGPAGGPAPRLEHIAVQLDSAWRTRMSRGDHRTALAELLPPLVSAASVAASHSECGDRRRAEIMYASALNLTQMYAAFQGDGHLVWRVAERALATARASGDPGAISQACWFLVEAFRKSGQWESAQTLTEDTLRLLDPVRTESAALACAWADMAYHAAITHAVAGEGGDAWRWIDRASAVSNALPVGYWRPSTSGSRQAAAMHSVTVAVELRQVGTALRWARRLPEADVIAIPRRGRHLIEVARAHSMKGEHGKTSELLTTAVEVAPETARWNEEARSLIRDLMKGVTTHQPAGRRLAEAIGMAA
ncbi:multiprotein-bridging factor 1 family protein [Kitasatospora sp. NPDC101183]|uniref:helix-turn-helix domain-containing protein n=1 Tax=Kitasatospora sp. NPDC101183 TaxID=3364100 RepID=UPI0037F26004